jgi:hypothetical protein
MCEDHGRGGSTRIDQWSMRDDGRGGGAGEFSTSPRSSSMRVGSVLKRMCQPLQALRGTRTAGESKRWVTQDHSLSITPPRCVMMRISGLCGGWSVAAIQLSYRSLRVVGGMTNALVASSPA